MNKLKSLLLAALIIAVVVPTAVFAIPSSVDRITDHIEPLIRTDYIKAPYFTATSTTATSTFPRINLTNLMSLDEGARIYTAGANGTVANFSSDFDEGESGLWDATTGKNIAVVNFEGTFLYAGGSIAVPSDESGITLADANANRLSLDSSIVTLQHGLSGTAFEINSSGEAYITGGNFGGLGLGTTTPTAKLHIVDATNLATVNVRNSNNSNNGVIFNLGYSRGSIASPADVTNGSDLYRVNAEAYSGGTWFTVGGLGVGIDGGYISGQRPPTRFSLFTNAANQAVSERLRVDSFGNISIGSTGTTSKFNVIGAVEALSLEASTDTRLRFKSGTTGTGLISFSDTANDRGQIRYAHNGDSMSFYTNGSERIRVTSTGNVGIGTTTPYSRLSVWGAGTGEGQIFSLVNNASTTVFQALDNGNIGIGNLSPSEKLNVQGTITGQSINATSTTATSTFSGGLNIKSMTPTSSTMACTAGDISWDADYIYICTSANTWKRSALIAF